jgi:stage II sporulation protein P
MIRIKVFTLKEIILCFIILILAITLIYFVLSNILFKKTRETINADYESYVEQTMPIAYVSRSGTRGNFRRYFLGEQLPLLNIIESDDKRTLEDIGDSAKEEIIMDGDKFVVQFISDKKIKVGSVIINNYTDYVFNPDDLAELSLYRPTKNDKVLIYHTHTSESYTPSKKSSYEQTDYYRTEDSKYNVVRVGEELSRLLTKDKITVIQDKTKHDFPSYNGAYKSSLATIQRNMSKNRFGLIIDIHRDALDKNAYFRPTVQINGETAARIMFVVGTNDAGLQHDKWMENLKFALKIQNKANEMYPGLFRELHLSTSRYNQHVSNGALLLEVGATGNTLEEAFTSVKYFSKVLEEIITN